MRSSLFVKLVDMRCGIDTLAIRQVAGLYRFEKKVRLRPVDKSGNDGNVMPGQCWRTVAMAGAAVGCVPGNLRFG